MSVLSFVLVDVETANADLSTICQVGIVTFTNATVADTWSTLVNPEEFFDGFNVWIHD